MIFFFFKKKKPFLLSCLGVVLPRMCRFIYLFVSFFYFGLINMTNSKTLISIITRLFLYPTSIIWKVLGFCHVVYNGIQAVGQLEKEWKLSTIKIPSKVASTLCKTRLLVLPKQPPNKRK
jgi:hypothetical protein